MPYKFYPFVIITFTTVHDHEHTKDYDKMIDHKYPVFPPFFIGEIQNFKYDKKYNSQAW